MIIDVIVPQTGESILEASISNWLKKDEEQVKKNEVIVELETNKASFEITAEQAGKIHILIKEGENIKIGTIIAQIDTSNVKDNLVNNSKQEKITTFELPENTETFVASPAAKKILTEKNINPHDIEGTGKQKRITKQDVLKATSHIPLPPAEKEVFPNTKFLTIDKDIKETFITRKKMSPLRKTIAQRLLQSQQTTAMLTTFNEVDMSAIIKTRKKFKELFKETHDINLGFMSFFAKASCLALKKFPLVNSQIEKEEIVTYHNIHLSVAVSTPKGLVVPVIRQIEKLKLHEIEKAILDVAIKGRDFKLSPNDMTGGTFTITNGGVFGSMLSTPIINAPQSAILGMHNIVERCVVINNEIVIRPIMYLALSYDHRIIDGKEAVSFLITIKNYLEDPTRLLLEV